MTIDYIVFFAETIFTESGACRSAWKRDPVSTSKSDPSLGDVRGACSGSQ
jgi:hypothetical protein